ERDARLIAPGVVQIPSGWSRIRLANETLRASERKLDSIAKAFGFQRITARPRQPADAMNEDESAVRLPATPLDSAPSGATQPHPPPHIPDHELLRRIGLGSYGEVWLARSVIGTHRAVKVVYRDRFENERPYEREYSGMQKFEPISRSHDGLVDILQIGRNDRDGYFYYVMELADDEAVGQSVPAA